MVRSPNGYPATRQVTAWSLVAGQLILLAGILWLPGPRIWTPPTWAVVTAVVVVAIAALIAVAGLAGLGRGLTASPLPSPAARLRTNGVYACMRHPIYSALLLGGAAFVVLGGRLSRIWVWIALLALLLIKTGVEEAALTARFPGYRTYAEATSRLVPRPLRCLTAWRRHAWHTTAPRGDSMDSSTWDERYAATTSVWGGEPNRFVAEQFATAEPGRALDLAAGEGRNATWLATQGWEVTAVDFSAVAAERGRQAAADRGLQVHWIVADLRDYHPDAAAYDAVIVAYLHLAPADLAVVLARAAAAVAPGGLLMVVGHDVTNLRDGTGGPQNADILYTPETISAALPELRIVRAGRVRRPVTTDHGTVEAIDTLVVAHRR
ncbi:methyltransferase domain-containing protein [Paractinoplanes durhamensis]|uniref:methyltransferase domain-containing protein n=1 Tax=Paractinoplanes durhamensis TaxID=113563 RepID=UPI0019431B56|nr:methyltransferase domain-containing protein [Actinoplanes durhamensis]